MASDDEAPILCVVNVIRVCERVHLWRTSKNLSSVRTLKKKITGMVLVALAAPQHDIIVVWFLIDIVRKGCGGNGSLHGSSNLRFRHFVVRRV
jgi:hypothetical protein